MRAHRQQVGTEVRERDRYVPRRLGRVDVYEDPPLAAGGDHVVHRLERADLVVGPLHVHARGVRTDGGDDGIDIDALVDALPTVIAQLRALSG